MLGLTLKVKQGCLISLTLFSVFINNLAAGINNLTIGVDVECINIYILLYSEQLLTYRQYKDTPSVEFFMDSSDISRCHRRRFICQLRSGSLPIAIKTGSHSKSAKPLMERKCVFCTVNQIENEHHL